ncbi:sensor histidine kinase [uncultured Cellulomonas sp.]|uniref:sensor histidine kinase n=1 Tax=uncultured Cellulomonas sp. TaxID=189682 RepID=UPI0026289DCE|nr:sensor histidine kinase [uncultured Cellulomonas sp.]
MTPTAPTLSPGAAYRHEAVLFDGTDEFLQRAVPFVRDGVGGGESVFAALVDARWGPLREALGDAADRVHRVDMPALARNPARIFPALRDLVVRNAAERRPVRGIGELTYPGRRSPEVAECQVHESLLNVAVPPQTPLWLLCPYDVSVLDGPLLDDVHCAHPAVTHPDGSPVPHGPHATPCHGPEHAGDLWRRPLPPADPAAQALTFHRGDLGRIRAVVRGWATASGLSRDRTQDLTLAVNELAANSLDHGGGRGVLRLWTDPGALVCEVADTGRLDDVMVGRVAPVDGQVRGRGVWMVNQLCDLVQIRSTAGGTVVRVHSWV